MTDERRQQPERRRVPRGGRRIVDLATHDDAHLTMSQVCRYLNVNRRLVLKWILAGSLPALKLPGTDGEWRFQRQEFQHFLESRRYRAGAES